MRVLTVFDVDGTLVSNIHAKDRKASEGLSGLSARVTEFNQNNGESIIATGRPLSLVTGDDLIKNFPATYAVTSVGAEASHRQNGAYSQIESYEQYLLTPPAGKNPFSETAIARHIAMLAAAGDPLAKQLEAQPAFMVSGHRNGYFAPLNTADVHEQKAGWLKFMGNVIEALRMDGKAGASADPHHKKFNVEAMPEKADKIGGLTFIARKLFQGKGRKFDCVIIGGDSGNDESMMNPKMWEDLGIPVAAMVAPANATPELVRHMTKLAEQGYITHIANTNKEADGVLEGVNVVIPKISAKLAGLRA
jgi:hydroxymethylpyrimidine pyrophosphatase-like HAD family hydrolase